MQQWHKCPECGKDILYGTNPCPYCKCSLAWSQQGPILYLPPAAQPEPAYQPQQPQQTPQYQEQYKAEPPKKIIKETKCTCNACGNIWFYGKQESLEATGAALSNVGKSMMCLSGCIPAVFIPDKKVVDLNKYPKCGSKAITKEEVIHEV